MVPFFLGRIDPGGRIAKWLTWLPELSSSHLGWQVFKQQETLLYWPVVIQPVLPCGKTRALKSECFLLLSTQSLATKPHIPKHPRSESSAGRPSVADGVMFPSKKSKIAKSPEIRALLDSTKFPQEFVGVCFFVRMIFFLHRLQLQEISYNSDLLSLPGNSPASKQHVEGQDLTWSDTTRIQIHTYKIVLKHKDQHHVFISPLLLEKCRECVLVPIVL